MALPNMHKCKNLLGVICLVIFTLGYSDANAEYKDWSEKEQRQYQTFISLQLIDTAQTLRMVNCQKHTSCDLRELNPIMGTHPSTEKVIAVKILGNVLLYKLLDRPNAHRSTTLKWMNGMGTIVVVNNGIHWRKEF
jgi:hypothetical protein